MIRLPAMIWGKHCSLPVQAWVTSFTYLLAVVKNRGTFFSIHKTQLIPGAREVCRKVFFSTQMH